ncbi:MAG: hypothetical protein QXF56_00935 [Candidatus Micrarchaeia archaeon]
MICKENHTEIPNLKALGISICSRYECVREFLKRRRGKLPICFYCINYSKKEKLCLCVKEGDVFREIDFSYPCFALFCAKFTPKDRREGEYLLNG